MIISLLFDNFGSELFVEKRGVHGQQGVVAAVLDGAFPVAVNQDGALFGLGGRDAADVDKSLDDVVEGVYIIVVEQQTAAGVFKDGRLLLGLGGDEWLFHILVK